ncbi:MAG: hypothetical protein U9N07_01375 [Euryarchaeota archaeon]|nr:hypothetical protein [Euryarchaeota archaeon]
MAMSSDAGVIALKNLIMLCVYAGIAIAIGYLGYSQTESSLTCFDDAELTFFIEGDLNPEDQMLYTSCHDTDTEIIINNVTYFINGSEHAIDSLVCGRNCMRIRSSNRTTVTASYDVQWKPLIERFQIAGLEVGEESDFFIYSDDVMQSYLRIEKDNGYIIFNKTFNGSKIRIKIDEIGNYGAYMQVFNTGWSDTYYSEFTAFAGVSRTIDNVPLMISKTDEPAYSSMFPLTIDRKDCGAVLVLKRACNGYQRLIHGRLLPYLLYTKKYFSISMSPRPDPVDNPVSP